MNKNKKGKLHIHRDFLYDPENGKYLKMVFAQFIPVAITNIFDTFYYYGFCDEFEEVSEGAEIPGYDANFMQTPEGLTLKFIKI